MAKRSRPHIPADYFERIRARSDRNGFARALMELALMALVVGGFWWVLH